MGKKGRSVRKEEEMTRRPFGVEWDGEELKRCRRRERMAVV